MRTSVRRWVAAAMASVMLMAGLGVPKAHAATVWGGVGDDCRVFLYVEGIAPSASLTIRYSTGQSFTASSDDDYYWHRILPAAKLALEQDEFRVVAYQGTTNLGSDVMYVPERCMTPGLFPVSGALDPATGRMGDASDSPNADLWTIDREGTVEYHYWGKYVGEFLWTAKVGARMTNISAMTAVTDKNGDRRADFLVRHRSDNSLWFYWNKGNGYLQRGIQVGQNWGGMDKIIYAGRLVAGSSAEYVLARRASDGTMWRYRLTNAGLRDGTQVGRGWGGMTHIMSVGSMWGDAGWDIIAIRKDGQLFAYRSYNGGRVVLVGAIGRGWGGMKVVCVPGDVTGDGRLDVVGLTQYDELFLYQNTGSTITSKGRVADLGLGEPVVIMA